MDDIVDMAEERAEEAGERLINAAAVVIAIIATFMALCGVKGDNVDNGILQEKTSAVDQWSYYQAKSMKQYMYKLNADSLEALLATSQGIDPRARAGIEAKLGSYRQEIDRYEKEKAEIKAEAEGHEANVKAMDTTANQLDLTEVFLSLAIALLAITILTKLRWLLGVSLVPALLGIVTGLLALAGAAVNIPLPDFLT